MTRLLKRAKRAIHPHTLANLLSTRFLTLEPRRVHLEDATDNRTIGEHVEVVLVPLTSGAARCGALQNEFSQVKQSSRSALPRFNVYDRPPVLIATADATV